MMARLLEALAQLALLVALAPLVTGVIRTLKRACRRGAGRAFFSHTGICASCSARAW